MAGSGVRLVRVASRPTVVVARATTWQAFPSSWSSMLDQVYAAVRAGGADPPDPDGARWQNVMLYKDDVPNVEVGVLASGPFSQTGNAISSELPSGEVATATHRGPYATLGATHRAICDWCATRRRQLAGPRWEIYGHHTDNPNELETEVYYLLH